MFLNKRVSVSVVLLIVGSLLTNMRITVFAIESVDTSKKPGISPWYYITDINKKDDRIEELRKKIDKLRTTIEIHKSSLRGTIKKETVPNISQPSVQTSPEKPQTTPKDNVSRKFIYAPQSWALMTRKNSRKYNGGYPVVDYEKFGIVRPDTFLRRSDWWNSLTVSERDIIRREEQVIRAGRKAMAMLEPKPKAIPILRKGDRDIFKQFKNVKYRDEEEKRKRLEREALELEQTRREQLKDRNSRKVFKYKQYYIDITDLDTATMKKKLLEEINWYRVTHGIPLLIHDKTLDGIAQNHVENMRIYNFSGSIDHENNNLRDRFKLSGVLGLYTIFAENAAQSQWGISSRHCGHYLADNKGQIKCLLRKWTQDNIARKNIENRAYTKTGIGLIYDRLNNTVYAVQVFAGK